MKNPLEEIEVPDILISDRLELCLLTSNMSEDINAAIHASKNEFEPWFNWMSKISMADTEEHTAICIEEQLDKEAFHFSMYLKGTDTFVGRISLDKKKPAVPSFEVGYWLHSAHTGKGYMIEAAIEICDMAINTLKTRRLEIYHDVKNIDSEKIIEKLVKEFGFKKLCVRENYERSNFDGSLRNAVEYAFTQGDD